MKIINKYPPNYSDIAPFFTHQKGTIYCYGDTIYNPDKCMLDKPLIAHEEVHSRQQNEQGVDVWWKRYCVSKKFRLSQEVEAYQVQFREAKKIIKDKNKLARYKKVLADTLSGDIYGKIISFDEALEAISNEKIYTFVV